MKDIPQCSSSGDADEGRRLLANPASSNVHLGPWSEHRIAIPHSKSTQYTLSISCLYHFARPGCSVSDYFTAQILFYFPFISPLEPGKEFLLKFAHGRGRLAANQTVIDVGRDINIFPIFFAPPSSPGKSSIFRIR